MAITKNSVIPIDMSIAAMSKVESLRAFSGKIRKWIYSLLAFMLKVYVFGIQKLSASWEMEYSRTRRTRCFTPRESALSTICVSFREFREEKKTFVAVV